MVLFVIEATHHHAHTQWLQWAGIVIVVVGLAITSLGGHAHHKKIQQELQQDTVHVLYGVGITLTGIVG